MRSTASLFNKTLFKNDFKRLWPIWGVFSIISALIGIALIYGLRSTYQLEKLTYLDARHSYFEAVSGLGPIAAMILSCIVTASIWGFLYTGKSTVFFHSVPITRTAIYFTNLVTSFVMVMIPLLTGWVVFTAGTVGNGVFDWYGMVLSLWALVAETLAMLGVATLCAQLTGRLAAMVLLDLTANVFFGVAEAVFSTFAVNFYYGVSNLEDHGLYLLSPVVALVSKLTPDKAILNGAEYLTVYALAGILLLVTAYFLYKIRKSESATEVIAFKPLKPILLYSYAVVGTIFATWLLYDLLNYDNWQTYSLKKVLVLLVITGTVNYFVGRMIIERTAKVLTIKYLPGYIAMLALLAAGTFAVSMDPFGETRWVPEKESISAVNINTSEGEIFLDEDDPGLTEEFLKLHKCLADEGERYESNDEIPWAYVDITYYMTDGRIKVREYRLPIYEKNLADETSVERSLDKFFNLEAVTEKIFHIGNEFITESVWIYISEDLDRLVDEKTLSDAEAIGLKAALLEDLREGNIPPLDIFDRNTTFEGNEFITVDLCDIINCGQRYVRDYNGKIVDVGDARSHSVYHSFDVAESMTATRAYLKEIGVIE